jgi:hypothetical protein
MLEPGTKVKIHHNHFVTSWRGLDGVVIELTEQDDPPDLQHTILVRVWEYPGWEDWEPDEMNDYWFSEGELEVGEDGVRGAEAEGSSDDEASVPPLHGQRPGS